MAVAVSLEPDRAGGCLDEAPFQIVVDIAAGAPVPDAASAGNDGGWRTLVLSSPTEPQKWVPYPSWFWKGGRPQKPACGCLCSSGSAEVAWPPHAKTVSPLSAYGQLSLPHLSLLQERAATRLAIRIPRL
jgi:hypothetical protein